MRTRVSIIHNKRPLRRDLGTCQKTAVLWLRTSLLVLVLTYSLEYYLPQPRKLLVFGTVPSPLVGTLAPQGTGTNNIIGMVSECTDVQRRGSTRSAAGGKRGRREETQKRRSTSLQLQANTPLGTPTTTGGSSSPAIKVGTTADPHPVRTSGAKPVGRCMAARDTANNRDGLIFI